MRMLITCLALAAAQGAQAGAASVVLRAESAVGAEYFSLGDIGEVRSEDRALAHELTELRIGRSPRVGGVLSLERSDIERWLAAARPALAAALEMRGADTAVVRRGPLQPLAADELAGEARHALQRSLADHYEDLALAPLRPGAGALHVPQGDVRLRARAPAPPVYGGRATVWIDVLVDGRHYRSVPVGFEVRGCRDVLVARRELAPGAPLTGDALAVRRVDAAALEEAPVPADADPRAFRLVRPVPAGAVLTRSHVGRARAVRRDEEIRVRAAVGAVAVETTAVATRDAMAGDVIRVRNAQSLGTYAVRVVAPGAAEAPGSAR
jgi:flagella basal body P-ring formation protein FlgA